MNEQRAVIQQMVDALDHADELLGGNDTLVMNGAAAGRWLLEQPAPVQEPVQEPKFWLNEHGQLAASRGWAERTWHGQKLIPLYTTPPAPQPVPVKTYHDGKPWPVAPKPWVGLSEDEINKLRHLVDWTAEWSYGRFAYELERLLREKNT
jgi:hypothetical protein